ncbi:MAG: type II toxin-antitoxin system Phd/YefM family antitoxin [Pseudomonadota bacterium]
MRYTLSQARAQLGTLCARAQDPRAVIVLTRHGRDLAAIVSVEEVRRIWSLQEEAWTGRRSSLTGRRRGGALILPEGMTVDGDGQIITLRQMAEKVRRIQMRRKEEREVLAQGGLAPVEGGEVMETVAAEPESRPSWWTWLRARFAKR